jgi:hypothetical protein
MEALYVIVGHYTDADIVEAIFFDREAAQDWCNSENDALECAFYEPEELPLIDNHGFHCRRQDVPIIAPWIAEASL